MKKSKHPLLDPLMDILNTIYPKAVYSIIPSSEFSDVSILFCNDPTKTLIIRLSDCHPHNHIRIESISFHPIDYKQTVKTVFAGDIVSDAFNTEKEELFFLQKILENFEKFG